MRAHRLQFIICNIVTTAMVLRFEFVFRVMLWSGKLLFLRTNGMIPNVVFLQVNITIPPPEEKSNVIKIMGMALNVERAEKGLMDRAKELQAEQENRVWRKYKKLLVCNLLG